MFATNVALFATFITVALGQATFVLDCPRYPDVCDNHCNAFTCHDLQGLQLHRDVTAGDTGDDNRRRTAIGCGSNNYCPSGRDCDEYPYASTYDGGLGCYPDGFPGNAGDLLQIGTTRCVDPGQNSAHGSDLSNFYAQFDVGNGDGLLIDGSAPSPLCDALQANGDSACPDESTGDYRSRSTPATPACPARGSKVAAEVRARMSDRRAKRFRTLVTDANQTLSWVGTRDGPQVGGKVWTPRSDHPDGGFASTIIRIED
ncbi:hypothetical protein D9758_016840 [Tetrapyrgos nigripes]|uniref:Deoxyribonuclease NucA/NucB domain-containing protein n=1 Tax=Tetrapyrgos nigripes TaxID=182062 RepID=A0A8H5FHM3_9AGAR|nr:hypothetical protein D9758_016840 [Tetrapyrgos nigripes]